MDSTTWIIIAAAVAVAINLILSFQFAGIAEDKGYSRGKYFWLCLLFGVVGYVLVAALPDEALLYRISRLESSVGILQEDSGKGTVKVDTTEWVCRNCQTTNSMKFGQCRKCGKYRS